MALDVASHTTTRRIPRFGTHTRMICVAGLIGLLGASAWGQVVTPPPPKTPPAPTPAPAPAPKPKPTSVRHPSRKVIAPNVDFDPITRRDASGKIIRITEPVEFVAMSHNPLLDARKLARIAPEFAKRRHQIENIIIDNIDTLAAVENGLIETIRMSDETHLRETTSKIMPLTTRYNLGPTLTADLVNNNLLDRPTASLTQKIIQEYQQDLTDEALASEDPGDGSTAIDRMMHVTLRQSLSEFEYYYRRLMLEAADQLPVVLPQIDLSDEQKTAISGLVDQLEHEDDIDARAGLIREIFAKLPLETQKEILRKTVALRGQQADGDSLMVIPEGAKVKKLDDSTRHDIIFQLIDGVPVEVDSFIE